MSQALRTVHGQRLLSRMILAIIIQLYHFEMASSICKDLSYLFLSNTSALFSSFSTGQKRVLPHVLALKGDGYLAPLLGKATSSSR